MATLDDLFNLLTLVYDVLGYVFYILTNLGLFLGEMVQAIGIIITYPFIVIGNLLIKFLNIIITSLTTIINFGGWLISFIYSSIGTTINMLFPSTITTLLMLLILIGIAIGILKRLGGVSIAGFKIGWGK